MSRIPCLSLLSLAFAGCGTQSFQVKATEPTVVNMTRYSMLAVDDLMGGKGGQEIADDLAAAFAQASHNLSGKKLFQLLEREKFDRVLLELGRQRGDVWNGSSATNLGQLVGAGVLLHGRVARYGVTENLEVDAGDNQKLIKRRTATAEVRVTLFASDTRTGELIDRVELEKQIVRTNRLSTRPGSTEKPAAIDHDALLLEARRGILESYLARVLPDDMILNVRLHDHRQFPELRAGNGHASEGQWQEASASYREALERMSGRLEEFRYLGLYNLGVSLSFENRFEESERALDEALKLRRDDLTVRQLRRVHERRQKYQAIIDMEHRSK